MNPSSLVNHKWKPCIVCLGNQTVFVEEFKTDCGHCGGTGNEPVEMDNPIIERRLFSWLCENGHGNSQHNINCFHCGAKYRPEYKHQVGVEFTEDCPYSDVPKGNNDENRLCHKGCNGTGKMKFLPLRQKVSGDNSILLVVPLNNGISSTSSDMMVVKNG